MRLGRPQAHHVQDFQLRERQDEHRWDDGEILRDIIGDGKRRQRPARHQIGCAWGVPRRITFKTSSCGNARMNIAGMMAKYFATSLAMENVVNAPRVIRSDAPGASPGASRSRLPAAGTPG